ncbi:hydrogenase maturation nickel metallochaperone HypA [Methanobrevibacter olleyae]|uniref:Hydrogenase maturation factor HypA n=1 Tax=Methanobrevibacter olleyae TaxID=294671 RepID=A0A126R0S6_METOL|nr:hydrogenase maturation nickel metallochaperone HypA [Methanobrevibacter olleyae]AMK15664.1 hydrogenase nickel insertion protein HypA [Methanobrevibacter olleyae]SFL23561.1 hydrogenase nickel incorporation protein HypA/HybF [Methanobrevibacter olleyae]
MHSSTVVQSILNVALETAEEYDANKVTEINVEIGKLNWITTDKLKYIFSVLSKDTLAENAELIVNEADAKIKCYNCNYIGLIDNINKEIIPMVLCPKCGSHRVNVLKGYDLNIGNITIEK